MSPIRGRVGPKHGLLMRRVDCPEAPEHLRILYLTPNQLAGADEGEEVELSYGKTPSRGDWRVTKRLGR